MGVSAGFPLSALLLLLLLLLQGHAAAAAQCSSSDCLRGEKRPLAR